MFPLGNFLQKPIYLIGQDVQNFYANIPQGNLYVCRKKPHVFLHPLQIFELETAVEKLQQDVRKETTKKDTATQALRDGLEIVKAKKLEYETKMNEVEKETEEMKKGFEIKIADLEQEVVRLKSSSSSESDEKTVLSVILFLYWNLMLGLQVCKFDPNAIRSDSF